MGKKYKSKLTDNQIIIIDNIIDYLNREKVFKWRKHKEFMMKEERENHDFYSTQWEYWNWSKQGKEKINNMINWIFGVKDAVDEYFDKSGKII